MSQIRITITRKEGQLGFSYEHEGIFGERPISREPYGGSFGTIQGLRESLMKLLDTIEQNDVKRVNYLRKIISSDALPTEIKDLIIKELDRWDRAVEANKRDKELAHLRIQQLDEAVRR